MLVKRGTLEDVYGAAPQRLSDMVKAALLEPQCPASGNGTLVGSTSEADAIGSHGIRFSSVAVPGWWAMRSERIQGHEWGT